MGFQSGLRSSALVFSLLLKTTGIMAASQNINLQSGQVFQFPSQWHQLGPFAIGTRESEWGADPLEHEVYGGFQALEPDETSVFRSSLARNGTVKWGVTNASSKNDRDPNSVSLSISFPDIDWDMMQSTYGWAGLQFQAWTRGYFDFNPPLGAHDYVLAVHTKQVQEIWIDGKHYFGGDVYGYGKAPITVEPIEAGRHTIDVRAVNDIRMFGGRKPPRVDIELVFEYLCNKLSIIEAASVFPDIVGGKAAGEYATIAVRINHGSPIEIFDVQSDEESVDLKLSKSVKILNSQTRPLKLKLKATKAVKRLGITIKYRTELGQEVRHSTNIKLDQKSIDTPYTPHTYTYIHPSGIVSYGIIRPPSLESQCERSKPLPILLALHGAGVDTKSDMSRNSFQALPDLCAFVVIPSGVTSWSGDDWHTWGLADVDAAVAAIPDWMTSIGWDGPEVDTNKWLCAGHSNGGQGSWYTLIHRNDKIIGGAPISGYLSIPGYVPYVLWHELEPRALSVLQSSINTYRLDLLVDNLAGTPILQVHGESDHNVPVFHSRRMFELLQKSVQVEGFENPGYSELPNTRHWFDGIMTYGAMGSFLSNFFSTTRPIPQLGEEFSIVVGNPGAMSSRGGIRVLQLSNPGEFGRMKIKIIAQSDIDVTWSISTSNIRRFELNTELVRARISAVPSLLRIDGSEISISPSGGTYNFLFEGGKWTLSKDEQWKLLERHGSQIGGLQAIFNTKGALRLLVHGPQPREYVGRGEDLVRSIFQYYSADTEVGWTEELKEDTTGNLVLVGNFDKNDLPPELKESFPISQTDDGDIVFKLSNGETRTYSKTPGMGMMFIFPVSGKERVAISIWGSDAAGVRRIFRLFPIRTGVSQPDFILLGPESGWKGAAGALALGMLDSHWQIQPSASYFKFQ